MVSQGLGPLRFVPLGLLRLAAKTEIREEAPIFMQAQLIKERSCDAAGDLREPVCFARGIGQNDPKENRRFARRVQSETVLSTDHLLIGEFLD